MAIPTTHTTTNTAEERDTAYRHALAEYHASLRENFLSFLWSRPAYESFTPERNGGRSQTTRDKCAAPSLTESAIKSVGDAGKVWKKERSPLLETSRNVVNPLTGRRWGETQDVIPRHGRKTAQQEGKGYVAPAMERSVPLPAAPTVTHLAPPPPPPPRQHTLPTRPHVKRHGTSSSSFGIRGRVDDHSPPIAPLFGGIGKGSGGGWQGMGNRSFHGFRTRSESVSSTSSADVHEDEDGDHHTPPSLSHRSSTSSLAITSPTALHHSDEPTITNVPRHSMDSTTSPGPHHAHKPRQLRLPSVPAVSPFGDLYNNGMRRTFTPGKAVTPGTAGTMGTEGTEASFQALAPSPL